MDHTPQEEIASLRERINELEADRSIQYNGARMMASYVIRHLKNPTHHNDGELLTLAQGTLKKTYPSTTPWLIQMMEVARRDINELPQQVFRLKEEVERLKQDLATCEEECTSLRSQVKYLEDDNTDMRMQITDMNEAL